MAFVVLTFHIRLYVLVLWGLLQPWVRMNPRFAKWWYDDEIIFHREGFEVGQIGDEARELFASMVGELTAILLSNRKVFMYEELTASMKAVCIDAFYNRMEEDEKNKQMLEDILDGDIIGEGMTQAKTLASVGAKKVTSIARLRHRDDESTCTGDQSSGEQPLRDWSAENVRRFVGQMCTVQDLHVAMMRHGK